MKRFLLVAACVAVSVFAPVTAQAEDNLTLGDVLDSSATYFPKIKEALAKIDAARGGVEEAKGAFDARLDNKSYARLRGFYSGDFNSTEIVKPFENFNAEVAIGYRQSNGDFPVYQDYFYTNGDGEASLRVAISLLRDRDFDKDRFKLAQSNLKLNDAVIDATITKLDVQNKAVKAYLDWLSAGKKYHVYKGLLGIALDREKALKSRMKQGDIAEIAIVENEQFILQRREILASARRDFDNAANFLSLFLRDAESQPIVTDLRDLPARFPRLDAAQHENLAAEVERLETVNPDILKIQNEMEMARNEIRIGENNLKPRLDVELYNAEDFGFGADGSLSREGFESTIMVNLSIPLQRRLGRGQISRGKAILKQLEFAETLQKDQIRVSLENLINNIEAAQEIVELTVKEQRVAAKMEEAERTRFDNGQSDFFLVNIREVNTANAMIKNIAARESFAKTISDFQVATVNFEALGLDVEKP